MDTMAAVGQAIPADRTRLFTRGVTTMQRRSCFALTGLMLGLTLATAGLALASTVTFQDGTFTNAQWTTTVEVLNGGGSVNAFQVASGGNPTEFRRIENTLNSAIGTGVSNTVFGVHGFAGGVYDPATGGPILSIDYAEDSQRIAGGVQACGLAVRQAGIIYYGPAFLTPTAFGVWAATTQTGLVAGQFDAISRRCAVVTEAASEHAGTISGDKGRRRAVVSAGGPPATARRGLTPREQACQNREDMSSHCGGPPGDPTLSPVPVRWGQP